jgi:hypothetical protein
MLDYAEAANDWLYLGVSLGLGFDTMEAEPLVFDSDPSGYAAGIFAGARFLEAGGFALTAEARHNRVYNDGESATQTATLDYGETTGRLGALFRWRDLELGAGAYTLRIDGEIDATGTPTGSADFAETEQSGIYAGARIRIDGGYALGVKVESGAREGYALTFSTRY